MTIVSIHQPGYMPWSGFFKKMQESDIFVYFDDVKFVKNNFYNRNLIKTSNGTTLLTVPVISTKESSLINNVKIANTHHWKTKHKKSILLSYSKSKFFNEFNNFIEELYDKKFDLLIDINMEIIEYIKKQLNIQTKTIFSSELQASGSGSDKVLNICKTLGATNYISGTFWAKDNLNILDFEHNNISVKFKEFQHPIYNQLHGKFIPRMAAIDLLFNEGKNNARKILEQTNSIQIDPSEFIENSFSVSSNTVSSNTVSSNTVSSNTVSSNTVSSNLIDDNFKFQNNFIVSIHQPGYLPWFGFFHKMMFSDIFVFLDDVQYERRGWQNRNKIRTFDGFSWLTVPVNANFGTLINEVKIDNSQNWMKRHKKTIELNYSKGKFFSKYWPLIESIYDKKFDLLIDLNTELIKTLMKLLKINTKTIFSSELGITTQSSDRILEICKSLHSEVYISGALGTNYLKLDDFQKQKISVKFQNVYYPIFKQCYDPFIPNMSVIDLLFNEGDNTSKIIKEAKVSWNSL